MYFDGMPHPRGNAEIQVFKGFATVTNLQWQTWRKPPGKSMCSMFLLGGGGGGGGGFTGIAGSARGGGGGGGGSAQTSLAMPLYLLPDTLYIQVGVGGQGASSGGGTAGSGVLSYVAFGPSHTTIQNVVAQSGNTAAAGGGTGTAAAVGAAGVAGTIAGLANMPMGIHGGPVIIAGQAGVAGAAVAGSNGGSSTIPSTGLRCMGGGSGAGTTSANFTGGFITSAPDTLISEMRPSAAIVGANGSGGLQLWEPFFSFCGMGGSASNSAPGGAGGNGAHGAGGGGGGAGTTGGRGGPGGDGIVIIVSW